MNKNIKKILLVSSFLLSSCTEETTSISTSQDSSSNLPSITGKNIVSDASSTYTIVIPSNCDDNVTFASSELQTFLELSSGVNIPVISDSSLSSLDGDYISLGNTRLFESSGLSLPSSIGLSGYYLKRNEDSLFINAENGNGIYCGVYDLLKDLINLEIYSYDEYTYDEKETIPLLDYDVAYKPTFSIRQILYRSLNSSTLYQRRMRLYTDTDLGKWAAFAHTTMTTFLPYSEYGERHPDWYSSGKDQVCYSNPEVLLAMAEAMKSAISYNKEATFIQMGHEDNLNMCECSNCLKERELYGGYAGQELEFTNKLEEILDPWLEENEPGRSMKYVFFAYQTSQEPPAKLNEATGKYEPLSTSFRINKNVMVMYCPIDADFSSEMSSSKNAPQHRQLKAWADLFEGEGRENGLYVWTYCLLAKSAMVPINNFGVVKEHYEFFSSCGADELLDQASYDTGTPSLEAFRIYIQSNLQYNVNQNYEDLAQKFLNQYYGDARGAMKEFYYLLRSYYSYLSSEYGAGSYVFSDFYQEKYWSYEILDKFLSTIEKGVGQIESIKESDPIRYSTLLDRLRREECFPIYLLLRFYMNQLSQTQKEEYWTILYDSSKKNDFICTMESAFDMANVLENWRASIFGE